MCASFVSCVHVSCACECVHVAHVCAVCVVCVGGVPGTQWAEIRPPDVLQGTGQPPSPTTKNYLTPKINSAKV